MAATATGKNQTCLDKFYAGLKNFTIHPRQPMHEKLKGRQWRGDDFVRLAEFAEWLHPMLDQGHSLLKELLREVDANANGHMALTVDEVLEGPTRCLATLCILVATGRGDLLSWFQRAGILDHHLPMPLGQLEYKIQEALKDARSLDFDVAQKLAKDFDEKQWKYFPATLTTVGQRWTAPHIVPIIDRQLITGKGGFSTVYQVAIPATFVADNLKARVGTALEPHPDFPDLGPVCLQLHSNP